jgi:hypothetical protein
MAMKVSPSSDQRPRVRNMHAEDPGGLSPLPLVEELRLEHQRLRVRLAQSSERAERLRALAEQASAEVADEERLLAELAGILGLDAQTSIDSLDGRLRGRRLREVAVEVLTARLGAGEAIHYRAWFQLLREQGYSVAGKDPVATFLAQVSRSDRVEAIGSRSGLYALRAA